MRKEYEHIAEKYDLDPFDLQSGAREIAIQQVRGQFPPDFAPAVIDLGCGTCTLITRLAQYWPNGIYRGIDFSETMLDIGKRKLQERGIRAILHCIDVHELAGCTEPAQFDLVCLHFLQAHLDISCVTPAIVRTLHKGGLLSIATTTFSSFPRLQSLSRTIMTGDQLRMLAAVPEDETGAKERFISVGFELLEEQSFESECHFEDFPALYDFGIFSGWLTTFFASMTNEQLSIAKAMTHVFPLRDVFRATVFLLRIPLA